MIKRTLEISREPAHLSVKQDQLLLHPPGSRETRASIPCEDVGILVVDQPSTTYSHTALSKLVEKGGTLVVCGRDHLPAGVLLPVSGHSESVSRLRIQLAATKPIRKSLWKQIVAAKVRAQANLLDSAPRQKLLNLAREVRSGDPSNVEAQAARIYWENWLGEDVIFRRDPKGKGLNILLNYGYAIMRAAVARALVSAGLLPMLGLKHSNRSNNFCLADDVLEPLRPIVDSKVRELNEWGLSTLNQSTKAHLLNLLTCEVRVGEHKGPVMVGLHRITASLVRCLDGVEKKLLLPVDLNYEL
jgi:CRISP-associated protein Cas1